MKNLICPVSNIKVPEHIARVTAVYNILLMSLYFIQPNSILLAFIAIDFLLRGFGYQQYSPLNSLVTNTSRILKLKSNPIDKAPKQFAARLGGVMFILALTLNLSGAISASYVVVAMIVVLASLEAAFSFCVGCYIYTYLVLPAYK